MTAKRFIDDGKGGVWTNDAVWDGHNKVWVSPDEVKPVEKAKPVTKKKAKRKTSKKK